MDILLIWSILHFPHCIFLPFFIIIKTLLSYLYYYYFSIWKNRQHKSEADLSNKTSNYQKKICEFANISLKEYNDSNFGIYNACSLFLDNQFLCIIC
jgi:hypothetical protein